MPGNLQQNTIALKVQQRLLSLANSHGAGFDHCFLSNSGAMANENALKVHFSIVFLPTRTCFERAFAGRTLSLAQVTDKAVTETAYRRRLPSTMSP